MPNCRYQISIINWRPCSGGLSLCALYFDAGSALELGGTSMPDPPVTAAVIAAGSLLMTQRSRLQSHLQKLVSTKTSSVKRPIVRVCKDQSLEQSKHAGI